MDRILEKKKWTTKRIVTIASVGVFVLFTLYTFVFSDTSSKLNVEKERITISEVKLAPFQEYIPITGTANDICYPSGCLEDATPWRTTPGRGSFQ